jgi:hypothetical protein
MQVIIPGQEPVIAVSFVQLDRLAAQMIFGTRRIAAADVQFNPGSADDLTQHLWLQWEARNPDTNLVVAVEQWCVPRLSSVPDWEMGKEQTMTLEFHVIETNGLAVGSI